MRVEVSLYDEAFRQVVVTMGTTYAMRVIQSRLDGSQMWNEPWFRRDMSFGDWMRMVDSERRAYAKSLLSIAKANGEDRGELPAVPQPEWKMIKWTTKDKKYPSYNATAVADTAKAWAREFLELVLRGG